MKPRVKQLLVVVGSTGLLTLAACSSTISNVSASDPVIGICQQPAVLNIGVDQVAIDNANNTDPAALANGGTGQMMQQAQIDSIIKDGGTFAADAQTLKLWHPALANDFQNEAALFQAAATGSQGLTTNTVAVSVDNYTGLITAACSSFRVGTLAPASKPGPGLWDWVVLGGYLLMIPVASVLLAFSERERPRQVRLSSSKIFWLSVIWWSGLVVFGVRIYRQFIERMKLTPDDKKDDERAALLGTIKALEAQNKKLRKGQE